MTDRITEYTIGDLAKAAKVSLRTLRHYDAIGLLAPAHIRPNGYRIYGRAEAERLSEILLYREMGIGLAEIAGLLDQKDRAGRLRAHRARVIADRDRLDQVVELLDSTLAAIEGDREMTIEELYKPFSAEKQQDYEAWLIETYGAEMAGQVAAATANMASLPDGMEGGMAALREIEGALVAAYEGGGDAPGALLARHRDWIARMSGQPCDIERFAGLADLYQSHPDFIARYEALSAGFSAWLPAQMRAWAADQA